MEAIRRNLDFDFEGLTGKLRGKVINQAYQDPLQAIKGVMTDLRSFLESDLRTIRAFGIHETVTATSQANAPGATTPT